jgi:toxin CptA
MAQADFIDVAIGPSRILGAILISMHAAAIASLGIVPVALWLRISAGLLLLMSAALMVRRHAYLQGPRACSRIRISSDGDCRLELAGDRIAAGRLQAGWFASPLLVVARVRCLGERLARNIVLLPDSADADTLRRLRIFLRFAITHSSGKQ